MIEMLLEDTCRICACTSLCSDSENQTSSLVWRYGAERERERELDRQPTSPAGCTMVYSLWVAWSVACYFQQTYNVAVAYFQLRIACSFSYSLNLTSPALFMVFFSEPAWVLSSDLGVALRYNHIVCLCMFSCCYVTHHYYIWIFFYAILCYVGWLYQTRACENSCTMSEIKKLRNVITDISAWAWRQLMYVMQSYVFANNSQQIQWYHSVFVPAFKPFLAQLAVQGSARRGEELLVGMNESLFCRDPWLPVHLGRDGKCSSCHKHSAFLSAPLYNRRRWGEKDGKERRKKTGMKWKKREVMWGNVRKRKWRQK